MSYLDKAYSEYNEYDNGSMDLVISGSQCTIQQNGSYGDWKSFEDMYIWLRHENNKPK